MELRVQVSGGGIQAYLYIVMPGGRLSKPKTIARAAWTGCRIGNRDQAVL